MAIQEIFARHGLMDAARLDLMTLLFAATATAIASSRTRRRPTQARRIFGKMSVAAKRHLETMLTPRRAQKAHKGRSVGERRG